MTVLLQLLWRREEREKGGEGKVDVSMRMAVMYVVTMYCYSLRVGRVKSKFSACGWLHDRESVQYSPGQ